MLPCDGNSVLKMVSGYSGYCFNYNIYQKFFPLIPSPERVRGSGWEEKTFGNQYKARDAHQVMQW
jgi:hypothetical protein